MAERYQNMRDVLATIREGYSPKEIKMAIGIASDPRYKGGNMTGAVDAIEKIKKGLSQHKQVAAVLKRQNEDVDPSDTGGAEEVSMAMTQLAGIRHFVDGIEMRVKSAGDMEEWYQNKLTKAHDYLKTIYAYGKGDVAESLEEGAFGELQIVAKDLAKYASKDKKGMDYKDFMKAAAMMKTGKVKELVKFTMDLDTEPRDHIIQMVKGAIGKTATEKLFSVRISEGKSSTGYELYHKDFSSAMKHAYDFAKKKFKIDVDPKEIDDKVASGPRKPSKGKTNSYRLLDKDGKRAIQVQVYGMDNGKYELNMYKESVELEEAVLAGRDYKVKDGKVHISKANFKKVNKDYKNDTKGKERMVVLDPKTQATVSMPVVFEEVELDEALDAKKVVDYLVKKGNNPKDAQKMVDKQFDYVTKTYKNVSVAKAAEIISSLKEETLDELREPYAVIDTADGDKVVGTASDEKGAKSIISTSQLPPMKIKDKKTLKIVKVKKKQMIGYPIKEDIDPIIAEGMVDDLAKEFEKRVKKQGHSSRTQDRERMSVLGMAKKKGATPADMKKLDAAIVSIINKLNEEEEPQKPDSAKEVEQGREDKKKTRIAQLQLQIAKAQETINKLNAQEK